MLRKITCTAAVLIALVAAAAAYEMRISRINSWELAFSCKPPRAIEIVDNGQLVNYRFIIYEVKNETSQDVDFFPTFMIENEDAKTYVSQLFPSITKRIRQRYGKDVLDVAGITGVIKTGESKKGVAVFKGVEGASDVLTVYVGGLSGDLKSSTTLEGDFVVLYRTYKLVYNRPGDEFDLAIDPVLLKSTEWVWRE